MGTPSKKDENFEAQILNTFGIDRIETIQGNRCVACTTPNLNWVDTLSENEYTISGMCQDCQDKMLNLDTDGSAKFAPLIFDRDSTKF